MADKTRWTKPQQPMTYGDSIVGGARAAAQTGAGAASGDGRDRRWVSERGRGAGGGKAGGDLARARRDARAQGRDASGDPEAEDEASGGCRGAHDVSQATGAGGRAASGRRVPSWQTGQRSMSMPSTRSSSARTDSGSAGSGGGRLGQERAALGEMGGTPARLIRRERAAGHDAVHMHVLGERLAPGVEHGGHAERAAEVARIAAEACEGGGRGLKEQPVDHAGVTLGKRVQGVGQREDDVEVRNGQDLAATRGQPALRWPRAGISDSGGSGTSCR